MTDLTGKTISKYQLLELIDQQGATYIYKGFDPGANRYVAVKVLKSEYASNPDKARIFESQSQLLAKMNHPNILPIYDAGRDGEVLYRAMPYLESGSVEKHLSTFYNPMKALGLLAGVKEGLNSIHSQGYVHGNLDPAHMMLDPNDNPMLSNFGLTVPLSGKTNAYMAPEQVQGAAVDRRADVYGLGVLLYTLLIGQAPPAGVTVSPRSVRSDIPASVEQVILKAMAQNPDARFQTEDAFYGALDSALRPVAPPPQPTAAPPPQAVQPAPQQKSGSNWVGILLGILVVIALCIAAGVFFPQIKEAISGTEVPPVVTEPVQPPPIEPTKPPEAKPTKPPVEKPTEPPADSGTPVNLPALPEDGGGSKLPDICASVGMLGGTALFGFIWTSRRRQKGAPDFDDDYLDDLD